MRSPRSSPSLPYGGLGAQPSNPRIRFVRQPRSTRLPTAHTWCELGSACLATQRDLTPHFPPASFNAIDVPDYADYSVLHEKLLQAIRGAEEGIGLQ